MSNKTVRTRFAPSPTGHLHIGNARTAIMNWIAARHFDGQFILRIEDTDQERSTIESEVSILKDLGWLDIVWDEGPDIGGDFGPYRQSERLEIYKNHLNRLLASGDVYPCYCTAEELEARRKAQLERGEQPAYDGHCRNLTEDQKNTHTEEGRAPSFRFKVRVDEVTFTDLIKGDITVHKENLGDFILARPDGMPMYNFACVVDDALMDITHVVRGDDHVSNTPRQIMIYRALGFDIPAFAHIPMILGPDKQRLSKRHGATSVSQYRELGYLPEALINFLSLLSWSSETGDEILSKERLIDEFDFARISRSASVFDTEKLDWMNGVYIREQVGVDELAALASRWFESAFGVTDADTIKPVVSALQIKLEKLSEIPEKAALFFQDKVSPENDEAAGLLHDPDAQTVFKAFMEASESLPEWDSAVFLGLLKSIQKSTGIKGKMLWMPMRVALTGRVHGPEIGPVAEIFGLDKCRRFVQAAIG